MYFNVNFRRIREKWGTQEQVAEMLGSTRNKIKSYEDETEPNMEFIFLLENLTGLSFRDLYSRIVSDDEIPDNPGEKITRRSELEGQLSTEPVVAYESPLVNDQALRDRLADHEARIRRLEQQLGKK